MEITYYGHSCFQVSAGGKTLLFDPFISGNELAKSIDINTIKADYILITHAHGDHILDVKQIQNNTGAILIANYEVISWFEKTGIKSGIPMNLGGSVLLDFGTVKMVNAIHSSSFPDGSYGGNPAGFVVQAEGKTFYYSGDTALTYDMKLIGEEFSIDFAFLSIGDNFTMGLTDAIKAARLVSTEKIIGMHYDTFPPIKIDHDLARHKAQQADKKLILMNIGETIEL